MSDTLYRSERLGLRLFLVPLGICLLALGTRALAAPAAVVPAEQLPLSGEDTWTLEQALNRALQANPDLVAAKYEYERQEGARLQLVARLVPQVSGRGSASRRQEGLVDNAPGAPPSAVTAVAQQSYDLSVEIRQTVFDGFSSWNQAKRQGLMSKQAFLMLQTAVTRTVSAVRQGFDAIQLRSTVVEAERRRLEEYTQVVEITARKQAAGDIPEFELLRAQAEREGARADVAEAMRALAQADQSFRRLLQIPSSGGALKVAGVFEPRAFSLPLDEAIAMAKLHRTDLAAAGLALKAARLNEKAETGNYVPKLDAFASYGFRSSYYDVNNQLNGWTYGAIGQWNIFDGGAGRGRRVSLRADRRAAESKLAEAEQGIVSKLHELYEGLHQAGVALEAQRTSAGMAERAWRDARRLYEVGQANLEQVLQASMTNRRAESRLGEAIYNYNATVAEIEFSVGGQVSDSLKIPDTWKP